jgi:cysteinyl-tRNA synthetase
MKLFNSLTHKKEDFHSIHPGKVSMYTCGPTVYNYAHIGNFFAYISADTLYRWLKFGEKYETKWVLNITDIDDKTIDGSQKKYPQEEPLKALKKFCSFYEEAFFKDLEALHIPQSSFFKNPRALDYIDTQKDLIQKLIAKKYAYISGDSVYFNIQEYQKEKKYGRLIKIDEGFEQGKRIDNDEYEKDGIADFVLWKGKKGNEPFWNLEIIDLQTNKSHSLPGRPGWHLECSAMEKDILDLPFDIHTGGCDLKFPHHENEIAQSHGAYNQDPTNYWIHNGHLMVEGEKMAKSKKNFFRLTDLIKDQNIKPEVIRLLMVTNHYRKDFNFTKNGIHAMSKHIQKARNMYKKVSEFECDKNDTRRYEQQSPEVRQSFFKDIDNHKLSFENDMKDDLNTPHAFTEFLAFLVSIENMNTFIEAQKSQILDFFHFVSDVFGVDFRFQEIIIPQEIIDLAEKRIQARKEKDYALSDILRDKIAEKGFLVQDKTQETYDISKIV